MKTTIIMRDRFDDIRHSRNVLIYALFTTFAIQMASPMPSIAAPPSGYVLTWSDEFNQGVGKAPSSANWTYDLGNNGGWGNSELETYTNALANAQIVSDSTATDGEALAITAIDTNGGVGTAGVYTSARLKSEGLVQPQYGFIEARIRLPHGDGIWPAFWMLGSDINSDPWPLCGESDIMENLGMSSWLGQTQSTVHGATSSGGDWQVYYTYDLPSGQDFDSSYHLFQELWQANSVTYYVDGNLLGTVTPSNNGGNPWQLNQPMFFLLNIAVGGSWPGDPDSSTVFPQTMYVDYVRLYEPASTAPSTPTGLTATAGSGQVSLSWTAASGAATYNVYRGTTSGGESTTPISTGLTGTSYVDTAVVAGTMYYYKVAAVNSVGTSALSSEASAKPSAPTVPSAPTGLAATAGNAQVALSWTASSGAASYNVYRGTTSGGEASTPVATGVTSTSYTNTGLTNGTKYYFKVAAVNSAGTSAQSTEASATPANTGPATITPSIPDNSGYFTEEALNVSCPSAITAISATITAKITTGATYDGEFSNAPATINMSEATGANMVFNYALASGQTIAANSSFAFDAEINTTGTVHSYSGDTFSVTYTVNGVQYTQTGVM